MRKLLYTILIGLIFMPLACSNALESQTIQIENGKVVEVKAEKGHTRALSWFGDSAGVSINRKTTSTTIHPDGSVTVSDEGGVGALELFWVRFKDFVKAGITTVLIIAILGCVLLMFPATATLGKIILNMLGNVLTLGFGAIGNIIASVKNKKKAAVAEQANKELVKGTQRVKQQLPDQKQIINDSMAIEQDQSTKEIVKKIKGL